ncbi:hypothetical protein [Candidatus Vidania fulgoroideorum]
MSKIGKIGIKINNEIKINKINKNTVIISKRKKITKKLRIKYPFYFKIYKEHLIVRLKNEYKKEKNYKKLWGTYRSKIENVIKGIIKKFSKTMEIFGVGYCVKKTIIKNNIEFCNGNSHKIKYKIPKCINMYIYGENKIKLESKDIEKLTSTCSKIKKIFKKSDYKKKGIFFVKEKFSVKYRKKK